MGAYDLGVAKIIAGYSNGEVGAVETKQYLIGARAPVGPGTLKAVLARSTVDPAGVDTTKYGIGYEYALSKRTSVHADFGSAKTDALTRANGFEFGVKHVF
jgi:predicted porin